MDIFVIILLILATYTDFKEKKIKNILTYPMILLGLLYNFFQLGVPGVISSLQGIFLALLIVSFLPGFRYGSGDIKLSMGIGAFIGCPKIFRFLFIWAAISLVMTCILIIKNNGLFYLKDILIEEFVSMGKIRHDIQSIIGAPLMLLAYVFLLLLNTFKMGL